MGWFILAHFFSTLLALVSIGRLSEREKDLQILLLRQQVSIFMRNRDQPVHATQVKKMMLVVFTARLKEVTNRSASHLRELIRLFQPETVLRWHRELVCRKHTYPHKRRFGRKRLSQEVEDLIVRMAKENPRWGYYKIQGELLKLGYKLSASSMRNILKRHRVALASERSSGSWCSFLGHYKDHILACDFFTVETIWLKTIYVLFFIELGTRRVHMAGCTTNPNTTWVTQQSRQLVWNLKDDAPYGCYRGP
jgi:putative transposase